MTPDLIALALVLVGQVPGTPGGGPAGAPSGLSVANLGGVSDTAMDMYAKHYKDGQGSAASGTVNADYTAANIKLRCTWTNGDPTAYTRLYRASDNVLLKTANPGVTTIDVTQIPV
jgi:hypothetical protein